MEARYELSCQVKVVGERKEEECNNFENIKSSEAWKLINVIVWPQLSSQRLGVMKLKD